MMHDARQLVQISRLSPGLRDFILDAIGVVNWLVRGTIDGVMTAVAMYVPVLVILTLVYPQPSLFTTPLSSFTIETALPSFAGRDAAQSAAYNEYEELRMEFVASQVSGKRHAVLAQFPAQEDYVQRYVAAAPRSYFLGVLNVLLVLAIGLRLIGSIGGAKPSSITRRFQGD